MRNGGNKNSSSKNHKPFWKNIKLRRIDIKQIPEISIPFALLVTSLVFLIGFVAVLAQLLKTHDYLYQQFDRNHAQVETLQNKIEELRLENRQQQRWLDNLNIRIEYYAPNQDQQ